MSGTSGNNQPHYFIKEVGKGGRAPEKGPVKCRGPTCKYDNGGKVMSLAKEKRTERRQSLNSTGGKDRGLPSSGKERKGTPISGKRLVKRDAWGGSQETEG